MDAEQRAVAAKAAMSELKTTYRVAARSCVDCIFAPIRGNGQGICEHFAHWQISHEPVSGRKHLRIPVTTKQARSVDGLCGPEGLLFEPYSGWRRIARWLARKHPDDLVNTIYLAILGSAMLVGLIILAIRGG